MSKLGSVRPDAMPLCKCFARLKAQGQALPSTQQRRSVQTNSHAYSDASTRNYALASAYCCDSDCESNANHTTMTQWRDVYDAKRCEENTHARRDTYAHMHTHKLTSTSTPLPTQNTDSITSVTCSCECAPSYQISLHPIP